MTFDASWTLTSQVGGAVSAPTLTGVTIADKTYTEDTGIKTFGSAVCFNDGGGTLVFTIETQTGVSINSSTGVVSVDTGTTGTLTTTALTITATNSADSETIDFNLVVEAAGPSLSFDDQDVVRGAAASIDASEPFSGYTPGSDIFSVDSGTLPLGLTLNTTTGEISGTAVGCQIRSTVTIRCNDGLGYNETASADIGVTIKAGIPVPDEWPWDMDPVAVASVFGWDTDVTVSTNEAALESAISTAVDDQGTSALPKFHKITYTGSACVAITCQRATYQPNSWVYVVGNDQRVQEFIVQGVRVCFDNFECYGASAGVLRTDFSGKMLNCKMGGLWQDPPKIGGGSAVSDKYYEHGFWVERCWYGAGHDGVYLKEVVCAFIDCMFTHFKIDGIRPYGTAAAPATYVRQYWFGNVFTHWCGWSTNAHADFLQSGYLSDGKEWWYENIAIAQGGARGISGWKEGDGVNGPCIHYLSQNCISINGQDVIPYANSNEWNIDGQFNFATPELGAKGLGMVNPAANVSNDISGVISTGVSEASITSLCPNVTGSLIAEYNESDIWRPNLPDYNHNAQSVRDYVSTTWQPTGGWAAYGLTDPADYGTYDWSDAKWPSATWNPATISFSAGPTRTGDNITATIASTADNGFIHWMVTDYSTPPRWHQITDGADYNGRNPTEAGATIGSMNAVEARYGWFNTTGSTHSFNTGGYASGYMDTRTVYLHLFYEDEDGNLSNVLTAGPFAP